MIFLVFVCFCGIQWERLDSPLTGPDRWCLRSGFVVPLLRIEGLQTAGFQMHGSGGAWIHHEVKPLIIRKADQNLSINRIVFFSFNWSLSAAGMSRFCQFLRAKASWLQDPCPGYFESGAQDTTLRATRQGGVRIDT